MGINAAGVRAPSILPAGVRQCVGPTITPTRSRVQLTVFVNVIVYLVGAVVEQVYSGAVTCSRDNTSRQYPEMLYFYFKMHQNAFGCKGTLLYSC